MILNFLPNNGVPAANDKIHKVLHPAIANIASGTRNGHYNRDGSFTEINQTVLNALQSQVVTTQLKMGNSKE